MSDIVQREQAELVKRITLEVPHYVVKDAVVVYARAHAPFPKSLEGYEFLSIEFDDPEEEDEPHATVVFEQRQKI